MANQNKVPTQGTCLPSVAPVHMNLTSWATLALSQHVAPETVQLKIDPQPPSLDPYPKSMTQFLPPFGIHLLLPNSISCPTQNEHHAILHYLGTYPRAWIWWPITQPLHVWPHVLLGRKQYSQDKMLAMINSK